MSVAGDWRCLARAQQSGPVRLATVRLQHLEVRWRPPSRRRRRARARRARRPRRRRRGSDSRRVRRTRRPSAGGRGGCFRAEPIWAGTPAARVVGARRVTPGGGQPRGAECWPVPESVDDTGPGAVTVCRPSSARSRSTPPTTTAATRRVFLMSASGSPSSSTKSARLPASTVPSSSVRPRKAVARLVAAAIACRGESPASTSSSSSRWSDAPSGAWSVPARIGTPASRMSRTISR